MLIGAVFMSMGVGYFLDHMLHAGNRVTKENESSSPSNHPLPQLLKERWGLMRLAPIQDKMLMDPVIVSGCCEFLRAPAGGGIQKTKVSQCSPFFPSHTPLPMFSEAWKGLI